MEFTRHKRSVLKEWLKDDDDDDDYIWQTMFHRLSLRMIQSTIESRKRSRKRAPNIDRKREDGALTLERDYWGDTPIYNEAAFRRRFRMSRRLFDCILKDLMEHDE